METVFRYVLHDCVENFLNLGWMVVADLGEVHGQYSVLMWRPCECRYVEPIPARCPEFTPEPEAASSARL